jgi:hypothetical protein
MALKDIAINIKTTGVESTAAGMKTVESAADSMGRKVNSATSQAAANWSRIEQAVGDVSSATGQMAAGVEAAAMQGSAAMQTMHEHSRMADSEMSELEQTIHGVNMRVMNLVMAGGLIAAPFVAFFALMSHGIKTVDDFEVSVTQIAAQLTQMQVSSGKSANLGKTFQDSAAYAQVLADKLEEIDANSFANNKGLMAMLQTMVMQGTVLDVNNKKQVETFTALSNAIAMYTAGQDQEIQARQEMRALLSGEVNQHSQLARIIDTQIKAEGVYKGGLKEVVELGQQHNDTIERLGPYLQGINAASGAINKTWSAASSSLETAVNKVTREGFKEVFDDVVPLVGTLAAYLKNGSAASDVIHKIWLALKGAVSSVIDIARGTLWVVLAGIGGLSAKILDGWGLLLASVLPVLADEFKHLLDLLNAGVNLGYAFGLVMLDAVGAVGSALMSVGKAALQALTGDFDGAGKTLQGMFSGVFVDRMKENMMVVKGTVIAIKEEWTAMQDPMGKMLDKADQYLKTTQKAKLSVPAPPPGPPPPGEESPGIDMEAYDKEVEKFREAYRALNAAYDKAALDDIKNATTLQLAELKNRHDAGLVSEQQFLDAKHQLDLAASDRDIALLMQAADRAQAALNAATKNSSSLARPADGSDSDVVDRYNNAILARVKAEKELVEAQQKVSDAVAKAKQVDIEYAGASDANTRKVLKDQYSAQISLAQAINDTVRAAALQIESEQQGRLSLDEQTREILKQVDALKLRKALWDQAHANDALKDQVAVGATPAYEQQQKAMELSYQRQRELEQEKYATMIKGSSAAADQLEKMHLLEQKYQQDSKKMEQERWIASASAAADSMGKIGEILMQGNRDQFEAGKAMMVGQAIIAAALAIVQCYAQLGPIGGTIAAVGVGAATLAQIAQIEDTEYKPRAMGGPVSAGGNYLVGEEGPELIHMGSAGTVIPNHALAQAGEAQLKATRENTKAIARLADGFNSVADAFKDQVLQATNNGLVTNRIAGVGIDKTKESYMQVLMDYAGQLATGAVGGTVHILKSLFTGGDFIGALQAEVKNALNFVGQTITFGLGSKMFGGDKSISGAGLQLAYSGGALDAQQYTTVHTSGGWFSHGHDSTSYSVVDQALLKSLNDVAANIATSVNTAGAALGGLTVDLKSVSMAATKLDLRGMTEEQANKAIEQWYSNLADAMASQLGGPDAQAQLAAATRFGETSYEALMRVTIALQTVNEAALTTGNQLLSTAKDVAIANGDIASSVIDAFGGVDKFTQAIDKYNKVVNSDEAYKALKVAAAHREITAALADQNVAVPQTVEEYRKLVESTDVTSPLYKTLIDLSDQFSTIADAAKSATDQMQSLQDTLDQLKTGDNSTLSPEAKYNLASTQFASDAALASAGNADALSRLSNDASSFLDISKGYYASGLGYQQDYQTVTATIQQVMDQLAKANGLPLPQFAVGSPSIPYDMDARVHANEMIIDAQSAQALRKYGISVNSEGGDNGELLEAVKELRAEVADMKRQLVQVSQYGFGRLIDSGEASAQSLSEIRNKARLAAAA